MPKLTPQALVFDCSVLNLQSPAFSLIQELLENDQAKQKGNSILISHEEICQLSAADQKFLGLPDAYPFEIKIDSDGNLQDDNFQLKLRFFEYNHGKQIFGKRVGCIFKVDDGNPYLLSHEQYLTCGAVEEFNRLPDKNPSLNLIRFADIKELSRRSAAILDSFLEDEKILVPEKISLKLNKGDNGVLEILPEISNLDDPELVQQFESNKFDRFRKVQPIYTLQDREGKRVRIPLTDEQQIEFQKIKKYRKTEGATKEKIIDQPADFFDPEVIDIDSFSDRVIEIGMYKPRYFPFVSSYKSEWIPGVLIEEGNTRTKVHVHNSEELEELKESLEKSLQKKQSHVPFKDNQIPVEECQPLIELAERQFAQPEKPVSQPVKDKTVLIIHENLYEVAYREDHKDTVAPTPENFTHTFHNPVHLRSDISLYPHQEVGIAWLESLASGTYSGGLLADDMGLGKTIQILSFIDWHDTTLNKERKPYLIIAPVSLLENWQEEYHRFFEGSLKAEYVYGAKKSTVSMENLKQHRLFITNYETVRRHQQSFGRIDWAVVALDEAQKIKTPGTLITNAVKALKASFRIAATGTPVENSMVDIWCIVDFIVPGLLNSAKDFSKKYQKPIRKPLSDEALNQLGTQLRTEIGLYLKRRLKEDILSSLPPKENHSFQIPMPEYQKKRYLQEIQKNHTTETSILSTIHKLKSISDFPDLERYTYFLDIPPGKLLQRSAKLKATIEILEKVKAANEKAIVFAEYRKTQQILQYVIQHFLDLTHVSIINGSTATSIRHNSQKQTRQGVINDFSRKTGFNVIIMSPLAAGVGLNVTAANHVIHYSRHWNPAKEAQATDRTHRIGQTKTVQVYYPMAVLPDFETFDVILDKLLSRKRNLADAALFPSAISEVQVDNFIDNLSFNKGSSEPIHEEPIDMKDINRISPHLFEAAIAAIFQKQGFKIELTPKSNDKGADIVAISEKQNLLIQVKQSKSPINDTAVGEILKAKGYFEKKYNIKFDLMVATNSTLNQNACHMAEINHVQRFNRDNLMNFLKGEKVFFSDLEQIEENRLLSI